MHSLTATLIALGVSGALGGILAGITRRTSHKARLPFTGRLVELGFFGDGLVGSGASVATHFLAAPLLQLGSTENSALDHWIQLISISVLAGFLGAKLLTSRTAHLVERLAAAEDQIDRLERRERIHEILRRAESHVTEHRLEHALVTYREVLRIDPGSPSASMVPGGERSEAPHSVVQPPAGSWSAARFLETNSELPDYNDDACRAEECPANPDIAFVGCDESSKVAEPSKGSFDLPSPRVAAQWLTVKSQLGLSDNLGVFSNHRSVRTLTGHC